MSLLTPEIQEQIRAAFAPLEEEVKLVVFTQGEGGALECDFCVETRNLIDEVAALSDKISVEIRDFVGDAEIVEEFGIDKIPAVAVTRGGSAPKDFGIRLYGIPSGYEFGTLIEDIRMVGTNEPGLNDATLKDLARLTEPVHLQVFVTPTCPYCPRAVILAHQLAMASPLVTADMVEASEFPHLANRYHVYGVPRTVISDVIHIEGAVPEKALMTKLMTVLDTETMKGLREEWEAHDHAH